MSKLIARFAADPTAANARRLALYCRKHPFASLLATREEVAVLECALRTLAAHGQA